ELDFAEEAPPTAAPAASRAAAGPRRRPAGSRSWIVVVGVAGGVGLIGLVALLGWLVWPSKKPAPAGPTASAQVPVVFKSKQGPIQLAGLTPEGDRVISCAYSGEITVWDAATAAEVERRTPSESGPFKSVALSADGGQVAWGRDTVITVDNLKA